MVVLDGASLTLEALAAVALGGEQAALAPAARDRMAAAREVVEEALRSGAAVYGLTTGVAERKTVAFSAAASAGLSRSLINGHRVSQGVPAPAPVVRAAMVCLVNGYARGTAGVRPELAELIIAALNQNTVPVVRILGSAGQSDLGPMADLASGLIDGAAFRLEAGEGLALLNSNAFATGWGALAVLAADRLLDTADVAAALALEAFAANLNLLHPVAAEARPYPGIAAAVRRLRGLLAGSSLFEPGAARNLQDPLTFRNVPQIHGAAKDALAYVRATAATELNSAQGNPAVVAAERRIVSVANHEVLPLAAALDFARIALAPVLTSSAERVVKLLQRPLSGLPAGLAEGPDTGEDALAEFAVTAQAIAAEARTLASPVSYEVVSTSKADGIEDRMTMAPLAARRLEAMTDLGFRLAALEFLTASQAIDLRRPARLGRGTGRAHREVRGYVPFTGSGQPPPADLEPLVEAVRAGRISDAAGPSG
jgi:histidine ammonia-lyase